MTIFWTSLICGMAGFVLGALFGYKIKAWLMKKAQAAAEALKPDHE